MTGLLIIGVFTVLTGLLAARFGADSRDGQDWREGVDRWRPDSRAPFPTLVSPF